jgi:hypothetical protein
MTAMREVLGRSEDLVGPHIVADTEITMEFYTAQPAPTQWIAVGEIKIRSRSDTTCCSTSLLVGTGRTAEAAVGALRGRISALGLTQAVRIQETPVGFVRDLS